MHYIQWAFINLLTVKLNNYILELKFKHLNVTPFVLKFFIFKTFYQNDPKDSYRYVFERRKSHTLSFLSEA